MGTEIKLKWVAEAHGEDVINLDDFGITLKEWNKMSEDERLEVLQEYTNENYDVIAYDVVISYEFI